MNEVRREGDTVVRVAGPWTPTVHRYLRYLEMAGIDWAPKPLAVEGEHERLTFLDADVPVYPLPEYVWAEGVLDDGARMLRQLHDASIGFGLDDSVWQSRTKVPAEVICHNDFSPHNLGFRDGRIVGAIDFDMCSPGPRLWDLAYFATRVVPLGADTPAGAPTMAEARGRTERILRSYGSDATWDDVLRVAIIRLWDLADLSRDKAVELGKPELVENAQMYERDAGYLAEVRRAG
ncbi:hypothetical protein AX769_14860 [Frondihabitans sp. PAMC 28766]|uniref:phosphotransferase n=1 Tax=Frondihabitans sp. PAMC 28766 TaxID=1795630 RepID=UPI00078E2E2A|nr:phosphotransferase [Frondihabitans sp. PAMC 28766]AMM21180.1 hypothetical protein AX769_14860 [Frondihabitans sp. PAMC 28766]